MHTPSLLAANALLLAALGCRDDTTAPTDLMATRDLAPMPPVNVSAALALSFWQVSGGNGNTCGVTTDNRAYCWGYNLYGQLGDATTTQRLTPVAVVGGLYFKQVSAGGLHTCGVTTANRAYCWGANNAGQLGDGTGTNRLKPTPVAGGRLFRQVDAGHQHTCGVTTDNRAYCWGYNSRGQLGDNTTTFFRRTPVAVVGGLYFKQVSAGYNHTCGITTTSRAYCWGDNQFGEVGDSSGAWKRLKPVGVAGTRQYRQIDGGGYHTCAMTPDNRAYCWGRNQYGQLGDGTTTQRRSPRAVAGGLYFGRVTTGDGHTCGESSDRAYCWGNNYAGQLGDGTTTRRLRPVAVVGGLYFKQVSAGYAHTCGKTAESVAYCWGRNADGGLGDGTTTDRLRPTPVAATPPQFTSEATP